ncbi:hypothetical protein BGZ54_000526 [Gamsiella multidivaricata]|nr:hypothetical protein BGZ54_000526 [Gamsiella multidivaricata]
MRIAAGASIRIDTSSSASISGTSSVQSLNVTGLGSGSGSGIAGGGGGGSAVGLLSTSVSSSTSSSSLSWASNPSITSPTSVPGSAATSNHHQQPPSPVSGTFPGSGPGPQQPTATTVRAVAKPTNSSAAAATAAVAKQAEENRRTEEAARTRRKIADLEISNASLLQVNQTLEATIRKQAAEMQELKLRMQAQYGGDLGLLASDVTMLSQDNALDPTQIHAATNPEAAVIIHELTEAERQADLTFKRLCITIEQMIFEAKQAMDQSTKKAGVKVLSSFDMYEKELEDGAEDDDPDTANQSMVMNEDDSFSQDLLDS